MTEWCKHTVAVRVIFLVFLFIFLIIISKVDDLLFSGGWEWHFSWGGQRDSGSSHRVTTLCSALGVGLPFWEPKQHQDPRPRSRNCTGAPTQLYCFLFLSVSSGTRYGLLLLPIFFKVQCVVRSKILFCLVVTTAYLSLHLHLHLII